ncbi:MAG: BatA domain-containing protein [Verrucomicrobiales bacterium]
MLNPAFLWAVLAVAVPVWLHLSRRRIYKEMEVGTLRFLHTALRQRRRKARLEEIPLLLLRCLALALLALAFARPFFPKAADAAEERAEETLILLDASGSVTGDMAEDARRAAEKAAAEAPRRPYRVRPVLGCGRAARIPGRLRAARRGTDRHGGGDGMGAGPRIGRRETLRRGRRHRPPRGRDLPTEPPRVSGAGRAGQDRAAGGSGTG